MATKEGSLSVPVAVAGAYAVLLCVGILMGVPSALAENPGFPSSAVRMPEVAALIAVALGVSGVGLLLKRDWARFLFLVVAPWGAIALGSVFAEVLWKQDAPLTLLLIWLYVPLAFFLARGRALRSLGARDARWFARGGAVMLAFVVMMLVARFSASTSHQSPRARTGLEGLVVTIDSANTRVKRLVMCDVPLWHYVGALLAVSIPTRLRSAR